MKDRIFIIIAKALRRQKLAKIFVGSFLLVFSAMSIVLSCLQMSPKSAFATSVLLGMIGFVGLMLLRNAYYAYIEESKFWTYFLRVENRKIVWIYFHKLENQPFGIKMHDQNTLFIHLEDRSQACISMHESEIIEVMQLLKNELPQATFGYSRQKEQLYNIGPDLLRK